MDHILEELRLLHYSLLPDESLSFIEDHDYWNSLLDSDDTPDAASPGPPSCTFQVRISGIKTWFEVILNNGSAQKEAHPPSISVKGEDMSRSEQERWQSIIIERLNDIGESDYPAYQLVSLHLLPLLHEVHENQQKKATTTHPITNIEEAQSSPLYHALFTSHHLISPNKRRSLQQWSSSLHVTGFAKVGYPGVIYLEGKREDVEEFVENVKAMQWLALRLRFIEPLPSESSTSTSSVTTKTDRQWIELQKVGEVVQEMKQRGREDYVLDLGIGSVGREMNG